MGTRAPERSFVLNSDLTPFLSFNNDIDSLSLNGDNGTMHFNTLETFPVQTPAQLSVHLKSLRKSRGLTQTALGLRLGVKQVRVADIERNPGAVSLEQLLQVLHALDARMLLADTTRYASPAPATPLKTGTPPADW